MTSTRLDLRHLRLVLLAFAVLLSVAAAAPHGASAKSAGGSSQPARGSVHKTMAEAQKACVDGGGTWTVVGDTAYCKGPDGGGYKCHLTIGPDACEHLPSYMAVARTTQSGPTGPTSTPMPTFPKGEASDATSEMSPLHE